MHVQEIEYHSSQKGLSEIEQLPLLHVAGMCVCVRLEGLTEITRPNVSGKACLSLLVSRDVHIHGENLVTLLCRDASWSTNVISLYQTECLFRTENPV